MGLNLFFAIVGGLWFWWAAGLAGYSFIQTMKSPLLVGTVLGVLGVLVNNVRRTGNAVFVHWADKYADKGDVNAVWRCATVYPLIFGFILRFPLMFVINFFGADLVTSLLNVCPQWILTAFNVMGGLLPALGFATVVFMIGKMKYLPLFIIGFFLVQYLQIPTMAAAIFGICLALLVTFMGEDDTFASLRELSEKAAAVTETRALSKKDVNGVFLRWQFTAEISNSFERMQSVAVCASFAPVLKKLYPDEAELESALKRHLGFFNTNANWGCLIHGTVLAMEEQRASGADVPEEIITGVKNGLMGPLAGVGDTVDFGTVQVILFALGASFATQGNAFGVVFVILFGILTFIEARALFGLGYKLGRESVQKILAGGIVNKLIDCASIVGMFVMGALSANIVKVSTPLSWTFGEKTIVLQDTLNSIAPGLLALAAVMFVFWGIKYKKWTITKLLVILIVVSLVGAFLGILTA